MKLGILGSCVTRDAFEYKPGFFDVSGNYFARGSIVSMMSPACSVSYSAILESNQWVKWLIVNDFEKNVLRIIKQKALDVVVIDLIDERFDILSWRGTYLNMSYEFRKSCSSFIDDPTSTTLERDSDFIHAVFENSARRLGDYLRDECSNTRVILHEVYASDWYVKDEEIILFEEGVRERNRVMNRYFKYYYSVLKGSLDLSAVVRVPDEYNVANSTHRWGLAPFHFVDGYYKKFMENLVEKTHKEYSRGV